MGRNWTGDQNVSHTPLTNWFINRLFVLFRIGVRRCLFFFFPFFPLRKKNIFIFADTGRNAFISFFIFFLLIFLVLRRTPVDDRVLIGFFGANDRNLNWFWLTRHYHISLSQKLEPHRQYLLNRRLLFSVVEILAVLLSLVHDHHFFLLLVWLHIDLLIKNHSSF
jgi:hypothetical protein